MLKKLLVLFWFFALIWALNMGVLASSTKLSDQVDLKSFNTSWKKEFSCALFCYPISDGDWSSSSSGWGVFYYGWGSSWWGSWGYWGK